MQINGDDISYIDLMAILVWPALCDIQGCPGQQHPAVFSNMQQKPLKICLYNQKFMVAYIWNRNVFRLQEAGLGTPVTYFAMPSSYPRPSKELWVMCVEQEAENMKQSQK